MRAHTDRTFIALTGILTTVGLLVFFSASLSLLPKGSSVFTGALVTQLILGFGGGLACFFAIVHTPLSLWKRYAPHLFVTTLVLTTLVFLPGIGVTSNGASRWLALGPLTFQPSELLKIGYVVFLAYILSKGTERGADLWAGMVPFGAASALVALVLLLQPDTDTLLVILLSGAALMFAAGLKIRHLLIGGAVLLMALALLVSQRDYLQARVNTFLHPERDRQGAGYHIDQSLIAVGSGGFWGKGFGQSVQKFTYLPEASSDAIFAVFSEEFGFIGSVSLALLFLFFCLRGLWIATRAHDLFGGLIALGLSVIIGVEAFLNISAMIGLVPVGGLALPFVSRGGSSLLITLCMAGIIAAVSRSVKHL